MSYIYERAGARLKDLFTPLAALDIFPPEELLPRLRLTRERISIHKSSAPMQRLRHTCNGIFIHFRGAGMLENKKRAGKHSPPLPYLCHVTLKDA